jgi:hypothetical protein
VRFVGAKWLFGKNSPTTSVSATNSHSIIHVSSGSVTAGQLVATYQMDSVSPHPMKLNLKKKIHGQNFIEKLIDYNLAKKFAVFMKK